LAIHTEFNLGHRSEGGRDLRDFQGAFRLRPLHSLKENVLFGIPVLVGVQDIAALLENPTCYSSYQPWPIRSVQKRDDR
jgi:hypothetical protein